MQPQLGRLLDLTAQQLLSLLMAQQLNPLAHALVQPQSRWAGLQLALRRHLLAPARHCCCLARILPLLLPVLLCQPAACCQACAGSANQMLFAVRRQRYAQQALALWPAYLCSRWHSKVLQIWWSAENRSWAFAVLGQPLPLLSRCGKQRGSGSAASGEQNCRPQSHFECPAAVTTRGDFSLQQWRASAVSGLKVY